MCIVRPLQYAEHHLLDHEFDLSLFDSRYCNDQHGASAYPPGMLLKVILWPTPRVSSAAGVSSGCVANISPSLPGPATARQT